MNDTKLKGDIAEYFTIAKLLQLGFNVLKPIGDRKPYDLIIERDNKYIKLQIKSAWFYEKSNCWMVSSKRSKTNRRNMIKIGYNLTDFDFALIYIEELNVFYVMPVSNFISYGSIISFIESERRQRKPKSIEFREAWHLLENNIAG